MCFVLFVRLVFFLISVRAKQLWVVLLHGQRGLLESLCGAKAFDIIICHGLVLHDLGLLINQNIILPKFSTLLFSHLDMLMLRMWWKSKPGDYLRFLTAGCFVLFLPGLLTAVTRMRVLQKRYFCCNVLCFYFYISFSNWMKAFQISAGICVICPSFLDF